MPIFAVLFFLFTIFNAGIPLSANWVGEILCLIGTYQMNPIVGILGATGIVLSAAYSIWLYNRITFGAYSQYLNYTKDINRREFHAILPLLVLTVLFGIMPNIILDNIDTSVTTLLYKLS